MQPHQNTPKHWKGNGNTEREMGSCSVPKNSPSPLPIYKVSATLADGSHAFYLLELSPHGEMCGTGCESLLAKIAWTVFSSAPLQTHGVSHMFPGTMRSSTCLVLPTVTRDYFLVSVNKHPGGLQAQFPCAEDDDRWKAPRAYYSLETVLRRGVLPSWQTKTFLQD